jgi:hypothetical protein
MKTKPGAKISKATRPGIKELIFIENGCTPVSL